MTGWTLAEWTKMPRRQTTVAELKAEWEREWQRIQQKLREKDPKQFAALEVRSKIANPARVTTPWESFKEKIQPGDELWVVRTPEDPGDQLMGIEWIVLVRAGVHVARVVTKMN